MEATKCLKPSDSGSRSGDRASGAGPQNASERRACLEKVDVQADPATPSGGRLTRLVRSAEEYA